jgi:hypothetical protein
MSMEKNLKSYFLKKERKKTPTPPKPFFFHLEASKDNSRITLKSSFIK